MRIRYALVGMVLGGWASAALIYFVLLPWEAKSDPEGFNYFLGPLLLFLLIVGIVCGLILGLCWGTIQQRRQEKELGILPKGPDAKPDYTLWPPPD